MRPTVGTSVKYRVTLVRILPTGISMTGTFPVGFISATGPLRLWPFFKAVVDAASSHSQQCLIKKDLESQNPQICPNK
jgi:hypothetical protein